MSLRCLLLLSLLAVPTTFAQTDGGEPSLEPTGLVDAGVSDAPLASAVVSSADAGTTAKAEAPSPVTVTAAPGKGLTVGAADGKFAVTFRARIQLRETFTVVPTGNSHEIQVRTMRFNVMGHVLDPDLKYLVQLAFGGNDFDNGNASPIFDAFVEWTKWRDLNVRVGQFFVPFDRARTVRELALQLVDRQQVVRELTLDRDVGVMFSSSNLFGTKVLGYHLFLGGGEGRNRFGAAVSAPLVVARAVLRPFGTFDDDQESDLTREQRLRVAFGIGGAYNFRTARQQSTYGTTYTLGTVSYTNAAVDLVVKYGGVSVLAEGLVRWADRKGLDGVGPTGTPVREWTREAGGYFVQAGWLFLPKVEAVARWEQLFAFEGTDPSLVTLSQTQGNQLVVGFNWYPNGHAFKIQADYSGVFSRVNGPARHLFRLQLDATF